MIAQTRARYQYLAIPFLFVNILIVLQDHLFVASISINLRPAYRLWWGLSPGPRPPSGANAPWYQRCLVWLVWG
jgi:hypothetical protein